MPCCALSAADTADIRSVPGPRRQAIVRVRAAIRNVEASAQVEDQQAFVCGCGLAQELIERLIDSPATAMDSMAVLLEAAAEDIKLIDCLGPEDLCHDPSSADGLKPLHIHGLRPRSARAAAAGAAAVAQSVMESPPAPALNRRRPSPADPKVVAKEQIVAPVQRTAPVQVAQPPVHGSANAVLAAALSAGDFHAPTSPPPVLKRPDNEPISTAVTPVIPKSANRPSTRKTPNRPTPVALQSDPTPAGGVKPPSRGSSAQPVTRVQRFAASIIQYIRDNLKAGKIETFESVIRKEFGNNPDISKALRLLVSEKNVKRAGKGGRIDPFTYKLAAKARNSAEEDEPISDTDGEEEAVSDNIDPAAPPAESAQAAHKPPVTLGAAEAAAAAAAYPIPLAAAAAAASVELSMLSDVPQHAPSLRRSASLPSNLSNLAPNFVPAATKASLPEQINSQDRSITNTVSKSEEVALAEYPYTKLVSSSGNAGLQSIMVAGQTGSQGQAASDAKLAAAAMASGAGHADSSMSNSPKESTASIVWNNPFQARTNTTDSSALRGTAKAEVPQANMGSGPGWQTCGISNGAGDKENNSPEKAVRGFRGYNPRVSISMSGYGSMGPPPCVHPERAAGQTGDNSGTASALSATASAHTLSGNNGVGMRAYPKEPHGWDVSQANLREGSVCADTTVQGPMMAKNFGGEDLMEATASKRAKLTHGPR
ncbi:TPA: hypothetical protein ACH3X1_002979 [Trebouxia sp. C0004]